jgi:hypothetical protein
VTLLREEVASFQLAKVGIPWHCGCCTHVQLSSVAIMKSRSHPYQYQLWDPQCVIKRAWWWLHSCLVWAEPERMHYKNDALSKSTKQDLTSSGRLLARVLRQRDSRCGCEVRRGRVTQPAKTWTWEATPPTRARCYIENINQIVYDCVLETIPNVAVHPNDGSLPDDRTVLQLEALQTGMHHTTFLRTIESCTQAIVSYSFRTAPHAVFTRPGARSMRAQTPQKCRGVMLTSQLGTLTH